MTVTDVPPRWNDARVAGPIDLVLVGYRPGALHAASRLGLRTLLVEENPPTAAARRRIAGCVQAPLEGDDERLSAEMRAALGDAVPRAVVSAGERGVLAAAAIRAGFGLGGVDPTTAHRARDKPSMKTVARAAGIRCTDWVELDAGVGARDLVAALGLPLVLKQRTGSGTRGLLVARDEAAAAQALASLAPAERGAWMAERFVVGTEMSIESFVLDGRVLLVNPTEYYVPAFANIAPADLPEAEAEEVSDLNARVLVALGIDRGMTHLELFRTADGPVFGEVAVRPPGGRIMRLLRRAYGFDPWDTVLRLELGERPALPERARRAAGVWMLHPGAGRVAHVRGLVAARRMKGVCKLVCRVRAGTRVSVRESTGSDVGWLEVAGQDRDVVARRMQRAHDAIRIEMGPHPEAPGSPAGILRPRKEGPGG
jgi:biotin carboxylase